MHWEEEEATQVVKMMSVTGGSSAGDKCSVKLGSKVYSDAVILAVGKLLYIEMCCKRHAHK